MHRILTAVFVLAAFAAGAVEITSDTTVPLTADSTESYEIAAGVTLTFSVASGGSYTLSGAITGSGAVRKDGAGELILSNPANSFSGGTYINSGTLRATASGAFGTGGITNNGPARLIFDCAGGVFPNSIWQTGSTAMAYDTASIFFAKDTELGGGVTAVNADLVFANYRSTTRPTTVEGPRVVINGPVNVANNKYFYVHTYGTNTFMGAINDAKDKDYMAMNLQWSNSGTFEFGSSGNVWRYGPLLRSNVISCLADNVISNAILRWTYPLLSKTAYGEYAPQVKLNGHSQRIRSFHAGYSAAVATDSANGYMISSTRPATLTILGEATSREGDCRIQDEITVVLDAKEYPNFVQSISNRTCTTTGDLIISNGTFRLRNRASFPNVPNLVIA
jgi:autotransporter-associated beta strand protein